MGFPLNTKPNVAFAGAEVHDVSTTVADVRHTVAEVGHSMADTKARRGSTPGPNTAGGFPLVSL